MDLKKFIYSHCVTPQRVRIWDEYSKSFIVRELPCGKCLHCRNTRVNEWVTRLYAQSNYSANVYYITLDYAPFSYEEHSFPCSAAQFLAHETAAVWHNINKNSQYGMHPLLLKKNHLQDFFKRLRKNTCKKFQYFACGEYGTHANGRGFGRPHFHIILFSNDSFSVDEISDAWSLYGYKIGRVDFHDLRENGSFDSVCKNNNLSSKYVFKYVCKYLQKSDFDFEKLATIDFHRSYFKSMRTIIAGTAELFELCKREIDELWRQYKSDFAPFVVCSRRPSLGLAYLNDNIQRFKTGDFKLFGLSSEVSAFPRYFLRKTKEALFRFDAVGKISLLPSSSSRVGSITTLLAEVYNSRLDFANFGEVSEKYWCVRKINGVRCLCLAFDDARCLPLSDFHLYDRNTKIFYQFTGYAYTLWHKVKKLGFVRCGELAILDVLNKVTPEYNDYYRNFIEPMHHMRVLNERDLHDSIDNLYKGVNFIEKYENFLKEVYATYKTELNSVYKKNKLMSNSKNEF